MTQLLKQINQALIDRHFPNVGKPIGFNEWMKYIHKEVRRA